MNSVFKEKVNVKVIVRVKEYLCLCVPLIKKVIVNVIVFVFFSYLYHRNVIKMTTNRRTISVITFKSITYTT